MGFNHNAGTAVFCMCQIYSKHSKKYQARPESYCPLLSIKILDLIAAASTVIRLCLLPMRPFQLWLKTRAFHPRAKPQRKIRVMCQGLCSLSVWFRPQFLNLSPTLGVRCCCKMLMADTFLTGWGMVLDGCPD